MHSYSYASRHEHSVFNESRKLARMLLGTSVTAGANTPWRDTCTWTVRMVCGNHKREAKIRKADRWKRSRDVGSGDERTPGRGKRERGSVGTRRNGTGSGPDTPVSDLTAGVKGGRGQRYQGGHHPNLNDRGGANSGSRRRKDHDLP